MTPTQRAAMEQAMEVLIAVSGHVCQAAHHAKRDQHSSGATCPVETRHDAAVEALRAALAEQPAEQEPVAQRWQPIETAPKGRIVLVYYKNSLGNGRTMRARYYIPETLDSDTTESGWADEGWYEESEAYEYLMPLEHDPTHWMPLPAGPDTAPQPANPAELSLKRYEPEIWREDRIRMELDSGGDWVKYEDVLRLIGAIEAPQPAKQPLTLWTEAQHERAYRNSPELHKDVKSLAAFKRVAKEIAAMYGITGEAK